MLRKTNFILLKSSKNGILKNAQQWLVAVLLISLFWGCSAFADFPPILVVDGVACQGMRVSGTSSDCSKYQLQSRVLVIQGAQGGVVKWGLNENAALKNPSVLGSWDGGQNVYLAGHQIVVPQVVVAYPSGTHPNPMQGYDGVSYQAVGTGTTGSGNLLVAYSGLTNGYIFSFGGASPIYQYKSAPVPLRINITNGAWPPSNLHQLPSTLLIKGGKLKSSSSTQGLAKGYWSHRYYVTSSTSASLHTYISPDGKMGQLWGDVDGTAVSASWNPSVQQLTASAVSLMSLSGSSGVPSYGPSQVEWDGVIIPFQYNSDGVDVYADNTGSVQISIDSAGNATATNSAYGTVTGSWDGNYFSWPSNEGDPHYSDFNPAYNIAGVSSDGMNIVGVQGFRVYTTGWNPGLINYGVDTNSYRNILNWSDIFSERINYMYSLQRGDGTTEFVYPNDTNLRYGGTSYSGSGFFKFEGSPTYLTSTYATAGMSLSQGVWPTSTVSNLPVVPEKFYWGDTEWIKIGGTNQPLTRCAGDDLSWFCVTYFDNIPGENLDLYCHLNSSGMDIILGYQADDFIPLNGTRFSYFSDLHVPVSPSFGPSQISWNNHVLRCIGPDNNGADKYVSGVMNVSATISSNNVVEISGTYTAIGSYNPQTYEFNFGGNQVMHGFYAEDENGNLLGISFGLVVNDTNGTPESTPPVGWGQSILLGNGTQLSASNTTVYAYARASNSVGVKYLGVSQNALFRVADETGRYCSPVYRYVDGGGCDFVINRNAQSWSGSQVWSDWDESNLYPTHLYVNGQYTTLDASSQYAADDNIGTASGGVNYHVQPGGETIAISWAFGNTGFSATVDGSYAGSAINGIWDGNQIFANTSEVVISLDPPPNNVRYGPRQIKWNGVMLTFDPVASSVSGNNPLGNDVYVNSQGSELRVMIGKDGSTLFYNGNSPVISGHYFSSTGQFTADDPSIGTVVALDGQGNPVGEDHSLSSVAGNFDIQGNLLTIGSWTDGSGSAYAGLAISFVNGQNSQPSLLNFASIRQSANWIWSHSSNDGEAVQEKAMQLDSTHRLLLYAPATSTTGTNGDTAKPAIVLDPSTSGTSQFRGTVLIQPQGDLEMGQFTAGAAPQ